jgi:Family of unknown function (DUF5302)
MSDSAQDNDVEATSAEAEVTGEAEVTDEAAEAVEASAQDGDPAETEQAADLDETKRKFREALERKHQASTKEAGTAGGRGTVKGKGAQGPATSRRSFRRKSG